jgi:hypothetical protein
VGQKITVRLPIFAGHWQNACPNRETGMNNTEETFMTEAEIESAVDRLGQQIIKLQEQQDTQIKVWRRLAVRSGWLSVTCVCMGALVGVALLVVGPNFYMVVAILIALFMFTSAPLGMLSRALMR